MAYATTTDLAGYLGIAETSLPTDANRLLDRASEFVDYITFNRIDSTNTTHLDRAKNATCAQVEYWIGIDESMDIVGSPDRFSAGSFSYDGKLAELAPRAKRILLHAGLLNVGVRLK